MKRSETIKLFLEQNTWPDLAAMYSKELEVQINVAQDQGERVDKHYKGRGYAAWTDGIQTWNNFRIPLNAMSEPEDNDHDMLFDLAQHVDGIGMTGWNWVKRQSIWVAFDFDAIVGHKEAHQKKLTEQEIDEIKDRIKTVDWVTLRRSTGSRGLHLYVFIGQQNQIVINNHNEHMALGRAILSQLSAVANFDFEAKVDVNAGNMWVWHRKMIGPDGKRNNGLELLKAGVPLDNIPTNWSDYIDVVKGKRRRTVPFFIKEQVNVNVTEEYDLFEELSNQRPKVQLDADHMKLLGWIEKNVPGGSWWQDSHWMLVTHTHTLKQAHKALGMKGVFETVAQGTIAGDHNCYLFPLAHGAWAVRRYTRGAQEHPTWNQDGQGWTTCYLNRSPDLKLAAKIHDGSETQKGGYNFPEAHMAVSAARFMGIEVEVPERMKFRPAVLKQHKDTRLIIEVAREKPDNPVDMKGFDGSSKSWWSKIYQTPFNDNGISEQNYNLDKIVRHTVNEAGQDEGWYLRSDGKWKDEPLVNVMNALKGAFKYSADEVTKILGTSVVLPYTLVNLPFDVEYPPGRLWNKFGAKFRYEPSQNIDDLNFPTWMLVFNHIGKNLTPYLLDHPWAKANNVTTGADYLLFWVAALFQQPYARLPFLFLYSEQQETGKSTFHECLSKLLYGEPPNGYFKITEALKANATFNKELDRALICVVEELDLNPNKKEAQISYNRVKELVTAEYIGIHEKTKTPCMVRNTTHWIQCSNEKTACPIFQGDTRVTMIRIDPIDDIEKINDKDELFERIETEAPDFLAFILGLLLPKSSSRLIIPAIETQDKRTVQASNRTLIEQYISEECHVVDGETILWSEFYEAFTHWMEPGDLEKWTKRYTGFHMPEYHPRGRSPRDRQYYVGNISMTARDPDAPIRPRLILKDEVLINESGDNNG